MTQKICFCLCLFMAAFYLQAQKKVYPFKKIDVEDLKLADAAFDPGAEAMVLLDLGDVIYDRGTAGITWFKTVYNRRTRIKILKEKGMSYANVEIPFYSYNNDEKISELEAVTYNLGEDGKVNITPVSKASIYTKKITRLYSRIVIAFPDVKPGSVIEYKYKLTRDTWTDLKTWYFQAAIPTRYSEFQFEIPALFRFEALPNIVDNIDVKDKVTRQIVDISGNLYDIDVIQKKYSMQNLLGIKREPYSPGLKDYHQKLEFKLSELDLGNGRVEQLSGSWGEIVKQLSNSEDFGKQLEKDIPNSGDIVAHAMQVSDPAAAIKFIYNEVRNKMKVTDSESFLTDDGVVKAWNSGQGNIADINLVFINLLNKANIKASPILLSTRDNGLINPAYVFVSQFNTLMTYIPLGNSYLILDASDRQIPFPLIPANVISTKGFIYQQPAGRWIDILDNTKKYSVTSILQETLDEKGLITGVSTINYDNYAKAEKRVAYRKDVALYKDEQVIRPYPSMNIRQVTYNNANNDSLNFTQVVNFTQPLTKTGEYYYFNQNIFSEFLSSPFSDASRRTDIDFGFLQEYTIFTNLKIPDGYEFESFPKSIILQTPDRAVKFSRLSGVEGNILNIKIDINFLRNFYTPEQYPDFREFYKSVINQLNEQIVVKKKH